ncbi:MAG: hypothetical protein KCHDKBKB_00632 [Elusimicrobia bacterium]|nr:hypothetical protein [Elusimicrobiota bacterium]
MIEVGEMIELQKQTVEVVECENCGHKMVNLDLDQVAEGDLTTLKRLAVRISNPDTKEQYCLKCDIEQTPTIREKVSSWFDSDDDDDDSSFFSSGGFHSTPSTSTFGGFGGFGGGVFSGGGASRSF